METPMLMARSVAQKQGGKQGRKFRVGILDVTSSQEP
jgi:hypothetical protein